MKKLLLFFTVAFICNAVLANEYWSNEFRFNGNALQEGVIALKTNDPLTYTSSLVKGNPKSFRIYVEDTADPNINDILFDDNSGNPIEGSICWDYTDKKYASFPTDDTYLLTQTAISDKEMKQLTRKVTILPEPIGLLAFLFVGALFLRKNLRKGLLALLVIAGLSSMSAKAENCITNVHCVQDWPFDGGVIIKYALDNHYTSAWFDVKFYGTIDGGETVFDLEEKGKISPSGKVKGTGEHTTYWSPDESFVSLQINDMAIKVEANVISRTFEYVLETVSDNSLPAFNVKFYGALGYGPEMPLENMGKVEGDGICGIALGRGVRRITLYPNDDFVDFADKITFSPVIDDVTSEASHLVLNTVDNTMRATDSNPANSDINKTTQIWFKKIGAGSFTMGSPSNEKGRWGTEDQKKVTFTKAYYLAVFETTQKQFKNISGRNPSSVKDDTHPVENVSYSDLRGAIVGSNSPASYRVSENSFFGILRSKTGLVFDLPTEAQWERACRAGTTTALNNGKNISTTSSSKKCANTDEVAWYLYNSSYKHYPVGKKKVNKWGFYDMHGNIREWCLDVCPGSTTDLTDPIGSDFGMTRGGSYMNDASDCRSACKIYKVNPGDRAGILGFRIALISPDWNEYQPQRIKFTVPFSTNAFPVYTVKFYGKLQDNGKTYTLKDLGSLSGDGAHDLIFKPGEYEVLWEPSSTYKSLIGHFTYNVAVTEVTDKAKYIVIKVGSGDMRIAEKGPMEDPSILKENYCRVTDIWLRRIEPGTFIMGSPGDEIGRTDSETQHEVKVTAPYYMGVFEITQNQWDAFMSKSAATYSGKGRPVDTVSYDMIRGNIKGDWWPKSLEVAEDSFLGKLRSKSGAKFDLPTEAQWEYACRAGQTSSWNDGTTITNAVSDGNLDQLGRYAHNVEDGKGGKFKEHVRVGFYTPNAWGLFDMHGNVWEWCRDWYGEYNGDAINPKGSRRTSSRVLRGGDWQTPSANCRSAQRKGDAPSANSYGFRIILLP